MVGCFRRPKPAVQYPSPPLAEALDTDSEAELEASQRSAKRRRIEEHAQQYLLGKTLFIASASLKGPFDTGFVNPWRKKRRHSPAVKAHVKGSKQEVHKGPSEGVTVELEGLPGQDQTGRTPRIVPQRSAAALEGNTEIATKRLSPGNAVKLEDGRPLSRASSEYCNEWLQRQKDYRDTPTLESEEEAEETSHRQLLTPSKPPKIRHRSKRIKHRSSPLNTKMAATAGNGQTTAATHHEVDTPPTAPPSASTSTQTSSTQLSEYFSTVLRQSPYRDRRRAYETDNVHSVSRNQVPPVSMQANIDSKAGPRSLPSEPDSITALNDRTERQHVATRPDARKVSFDLGKSKVHTNPSGFTPINARPPADHHLSKEPVVAGLAHSARSRDWAKQLRRDGQLSTSNGDHGHDDQMREQVYLAAKRCAQSSSKDKANLSEPAEAHGATSNAPFGKFVPYRNLTSVRDKVKHPFAASPAVANGSPGFPFRRVSDESKDSSVISNTMLLQSKRATAGATLNPSASGAMFPPVSHLNVPPKTTDAAAIEAIGVSKDKQVTAITDGQPIIIRHDVQGRWLCPVPNCRPKNGSFTQQAGVRKHLANVHNINHVTRTEYRAKEITSVDRSIELGPSNRPLIDGASSSMSKNSDSAAAVDGPVGDHCARASLVCSANLAQDDNERSVGENNPEQDTEPAVAIPMLSEEQNNEQHDSPPSQPAVNPWGKEKAIQSQQVIATRGGSDDNACLSEQSITTGSRNNAIDTGPTVPDHQDSRAYSTFTFNPEISTQAALMQAQQAFQETQSPEKLSDPVQTAGNHGQNRPGPAAPSRLGAITPFRELNSRPNLSQHGTTHSTFNNILPTSTQDLLTAAASLTFSTVKKPAPNKRLSFANWPVSKSSQLNQLKGLAKSIDWSPIGETNSKAALPESRQAHSQPVAAAVDDVTPPTPTPAAYPIFSPQQFSRSRPLGIPNPNYLSSMSKAVPAPLPSVSTTSASFPISTGLSASAPSAMPVPSFQEGQDIYANHEDLDAVLDEVDSFLGSWSVEDEVARAKKASTSAGASARSSFATVINRA